MSSDQFGQDGRIPNSWAMISVWNSGGLFKLRIENPPLSCFLHAKSTRVLNRVLPFIKVPLMPDFFDPFGFYFIYGLYGEGPSSGKLVRTLCKFVHSMARESRDCKIIVTEVGGGDKLKSYIPRWKLLSCPKDLWCIKALKSEGTNALHELTKNSPTGVLFVDPREV